MFKITFVEQKIKHVLQTKPDYSVMLNGKLHDRLYFNMRGYVGSLPMPGGGNLQLPEGSLASWKREARLIEKEAAATEKRRRTG